MKNAFLEKYSSSIQGVLSCYDRVVIRGTLPRLSYSTGMNSLLYEKGVLLKDITQFTNPLRNQLHAHAKRIAESAGISIEHIRDPQKVRKEDLVRHQIDTYKHSEGLVHILSAMESCATYRFVYNNGQPYLQFSKGRCLHYYFYFIDPEYGLCYMRVPTWCPFQLQFYFNAHNWLANQLDKAGMEYELCNNAFTYISDYDQAQQIANTFEVKSLQKKLDHYADMFCPVAKQIDSNGYHWSIRQLEYATDIVFKDNSKLSPIYDHLIKSLMHTITPEDVARFFDRKQIHGRNKQELVTSYKQVIREETRRIKHRMGESSIKMYDKFGKVLRIETTTYNTYNFRHYRSIAHRDGSKSSGLAPVKKSIYSLKPLIPIMLGCNKRYLSYIAAIEVPLKGKKRLSNLSKTTKLNNRSYKGLNVFDKEDEQLLKVISKGKFVIHGFRNKDIRQELKHKSPGQVSRLIKRLRVKKLIKKVGKTYKYYLTTLGRTIITTALNIKELFFIPQLNY